MADPPAEQAMRANAHLTDAYHAPLLTPAECDAFVTAVESEGVGYADGVAEGSPGVRTAGVILVDARRHIDVLQRIADLVTEANQQIYQFDLIGLTEEDPPQLVRYDPADGQESGSPGHYDWHLDTGGPVSTRKISYSLQLSPSDAYEGCHLEVGLPLPKQQVRSQGSVVLFPSYLPHRVTPVTSGTRRALVGWVHGPAFR